MNKLTAQNLSLAMERCARNPNWKVGISFPSKRDGEEFINVMKETQFDNKRSVNVREKIVRFKNGSIITAITSVGSCRGKTFNEILLDGTFDNDVIEMMYSQLLAPYETTRTVRKDDCLTNFLDNFTVKNGEEDN